MIPLGQQVPAAAGAHADKNRSNADAFGLIPQMYPAM